MGEIAKPTKLTYAMVKVQRERLRQQQGGKCALCGEPLAQNEAVLDHCHVTGHVRGALHAGCNRAEGKAIQWIYRTKSNDPVAFATALSSYWSKDYSMNPLYPTHKSPDEKKEQARLKRNEQARKKRAISKSKKAK